MSLYNALFGENPVSGHLLAALGLTRDNVFRYRDCYLDEQGRIAVYTRGGGGNRRCWEMDGCKDGLHDAACVIPMQDALRKHPAYLEDQNDDFDSTYCTFYFTAPAWMVAIQQLAKTKAPEAKWRDLIADLEKGKTDTPEGQHALEVGKQIVEKIFPPDKKEKTP
jgi:hypothetical protein